MPLLNHAYARLLYGKKYRHIRGLGNFVINVFPTGFSYGSGDPGQSFGHFFTPTIDLIWNGTGPWSQSSVNVEVSFQFAPSGGSFVGQNLPVNIPIESSLGYQILNWEYAFPQTGSIPSGPFTVVVNFLELYSYTQTSVYIDGVLADTTGINDYIILSGPTIFSATHGDPNVNCGQPFCPVVFSGQFIDVEGNNTQMSSWDWKLELKKQQGGYETIMIHNGTGGIPYSDFSLDTPSTIPSNILWARDSNQNVIGRVVVSGDDNEEFFHNAYLDVLITNVPHTFTVIDGRAAAKGIIAPS